MAVTKKDSKPKNQAKMNNKSDDKEDMGVFTKKAWDKSTTSEKVKGVGLTALAGGVLYATLKS